MSSKYYAAIISIAVPTVAGLISCGDGISTPATIAQCDTSLSYTGEIQGLLATACVTCHSDYDSKDAVRLHRGEFISEIRGGSMPPGNSEFASTTDGQKILAWLSCPSLK